MKSLPKQGEYPPPPPPTACLWQYDDIRIDKDSTTQSWIKGVLDIFIFLFILEYNSESWLKIIRISKLLSNDISIFKDNFEFVPNIRIQI